MFKKTGSFRILDEREPNSFDINMARDEALLISYIRNQKNPVPTLRFFTWNPATVSVGYFQKPDEIDLELCKRQNLGFVRRPTGGRSVFHDVEITYSVVGGKEKIFQGSNLMEIYAIISRGLVEGLKKSGFDVDFKKPDAKSTPYKNKVLCFDAISQYEITCHGKKVVGSAQVRKKNCFLQHGSIILKLDKEKVAELLKIPSPRLLRKASGLFNEHPDINVSRERIQKNIIEAFSKILGTPADINELTESEKALEEYLQKNKYSGNDWNLNGKDLEEEYVKV